MAAVIAVALLGGVALLTQHGRASAYAEATHRCASVPTLNAVTGVGHGPAIRLFTRNVSCSEALGIVRAMISGVGVTFSGDPDNASSFRFTLFGLPGWTCHGDGSGFPEGGAGGLCTKGGATVEWYHASR
jgi:hypothetical protein